MKKKENFAQVNVQQTEQAIEIIYKIILTLLLLLFFTGLNAQINDNEYQIKDRFGNSYAISDIDLNNSNSLNPTATCIAGYFNLIFTDVGTGFVNNIQ